MQQIHISKIFGLNVTSHFEIDFVDIVLTPDTELFLDPWLIKSGIDTWSIQAQNCISSYFEYFYSLYRQNAPRSKKLDLFQNAHEINETRLGYGNGDNGKAKTPEGMLATLAPINNLFNRGIKPRYASDLPIFIKGFAEDCLSDMLTNILYKVLNDFTLEQCEKYGIETSDSSGKRYYWDINTSMWQPYTGKCLIVEGKPIILVPKHFVRQRYYFNASQYFSRVILEKIQDEQAWVDSKGKKQKSPKKELRKKYQGKLSVLDCSLKYTTEKPSYLSSYHQVLPSLYAGKGMSNKELDKILYSVD